MDSFTIGPYVLNTDETYPDSDVYADLEEELELNWDSRFHGLCAQGIMDVLGVDLPEHFQFNLYEEEVSNSIEIRVTKNWAGYDLYVPKTTRSHHYGQRDIPLVEGNYWLIIEDLT